MKYGTLKAQFTDNVENNTNSPYYFNLTVIFIASCGKNAQKRYILDLNLTAILKEMIKNCLNNNDLF